MTWKDYQLYKKLRASEYDIEIDYMSNEHFVPFKVEAVNNTNGAWSSVIQMPLVASAAANLPDGRVMTWSAKDKLSFGGNLGRTWTAIFDPANNSSVDFLITNTQHDMFCPGTSTLPDGRIMVNGGSSSDRSTIYDPYTEQWSTGDAMKIARGYHSSVTLASGATFVIGGSWSGGTGGKDAEIWSEKSGWFKLPGVPVDAITDGIISNQPVRHDDYFPWLWVAPNGKLLHAGPSATMHWIDPTGTGSYTNAGQRGNDGYSVSGTTVMYEVGKILKAGGAGTFEEDTPANARSYIIDMNGSNPSVSQTGNMAFSRNYHSSVVMPNGEVMVIGGIPISDVFSDANSRMTPEIWNPNTGQWRQVADMSVPRNYHSVALLMMDGRIFSAGGGLCGSCSTNHPDAQIYSPPYLFNANGTLATRPVITSAPGTTNFNTNINVSANQSINSFALIRLSSTTHSTNNEQRRITVQKTNLGNNQYRLNIPNRNIVPPGSYMLFAMNNNGTPSVAKVIRIGDDINDCTPGSTPNLGGAGLEGKYYNNTNFTSLAVTRVDPTIGFNWGNGAPAGSINAESFSVRWTGQIEVPRSGTYTFYTNSDDGVRLWVDGKPIVDNWTDHGPTEDIGMITLNSGQRYDILLEYYEQTGGAVMELRWSGPGILKEIIPARNLFPPNPCGGNSGPCDDGNICTINDTYDSNCNCVGTYQDSDGDGVCDAIDQCPGFNDNLIGTACDDGNPNTENDMYQTDCSCIGTPVSGGDCSDLVFATGSGSITVSGFSTPISIMQVFNPQWDRIYNCTGDDCGSTQTINNLPNGRYFVKTALYNASWGFICDRDEYVDVGGGGCTDVDNDGICAADDCNDNDATFPKPAGTACNDGDVNTENDVIQADGCTCAGTPIGCTDIDNDGICADDDCNDNDAAFPKPAGTACNDGNANTENDVIQADGCTCAGTPISGGGDCNDIIFATGSGSITVSGLNTPISIMQVFNPQWDRIYNCSGDDCGSIQTLNNLPDGRYFVKTALYNASWGFICDKDDYVDVGGGTGCTDNDGDGICANQDCNDNDAAFPKPAGTACDDGNANTENDVIQSNGCTCAGTPVGGGGDCDDVIFSVSGSTITVSGLKTTGLSILQVYDGRWDRVFKCTSGCNDTETLTNLPNDTYYVHVKLLDSGWGTICEKEANITTGPNGGVNRMDRPDFFFAADVDGRNVALSWVTNTEYKNRIFEIERSFDGVNFENISIVNSIHAFENTPINYSSKDRQPSWGNNFYRIKKMHYDGTFEYSQTELINFISDPNSFTLFPNPAMDKVYVNLKSFSGEAGVISIYNNLGQLMTTSTLDVIDENAIAFDLKNYESGLYFIALKIEGKQHVQTQRLVVGK